MPPSLVGLRKQFSQGVVVQAFYIADRLWAFRGTWRLKVSIAPSIVCHSDTVAFEGRRTTELDIVIPVRNPD